MGFILFQTASARGPSLKYTIAASCTLPGLIISSVSLPWRQSSVVHSGAPAPSLPTYTIVSISIVHPYIPDEIVEGPQPPQPGPVMVDDQEEYEVEEILDSRFRWSKLWYLVKFVGWSHSDNMWLPHVEVHAPATVEKFHLQHPDAPHSSPAPTLTTSCRLQCHGEAMLLQDVVA